MTHQPPIPEASQSPYPLQPAPHDDAAGPVTPPRPPIREHADHAAPLAASLIGIGIALIGSAALAAWYYRREAPAAPARSRASSDRKRVAAKQPYEVAYFARKHGITSAEARAIITEAGPSRDKANRLAEQRKG